MGFVLPAPGNSQALHSAGKPRRHREVRPPAKAPIGEGAGQGQRSPPLHALGLGGRCYGPGAFQ